MPQATPELRAQWPGGLEEAMKFLEDAGFKVNDEWVWVVPPNHILTSREMSAIDYTVFEWDFGGYTICKA